jgi:hypothetical protein
MFNGTLVQYYQHTKHRETIMNKRLVERTQTGVRIEKSLLKVLKGLAEYCDLSLGDLLEGMVLHSFEGKAPFSEETRQAIENLKQVYGCHLTAVDSHKLREAGE